MLNTVIKRLQTKPVKLEYRKLGPETYFLVFSDAAFKKEEDTGHALKGTLILRLSKSVPAGAHVQPNKSTGVSEFVMTGTWTCHLIDFVTKRVSNVTRSTFSAELFSVCDAGDHAMILRQIVHEFEHGPLTADNARALTEGTLKSTVHIELALDAMSVFAATTATNIKIPSEKSLLGHLQYLREKLDKQIFKALIWTDTRDMQADGMTKGGIDREAVEQCMSGSMVIKHPFRRWAPLCSTSSESSTHSLVIFTDKVDWSQLRPDTFDYTKETWTTPWDTETVSFTWRKQGWRCSEGRSRQRRSTTWTTFKRIRHGAMWITRWSSFGQRSRRRKDSRTHRARSRPNSSSQWLRFTT